MCRSFFDENTMPSTFTDDPKTIIHSAINSISSLATLPEITQKIIKTVEDPRGTARDLHKIISHDPALVTRILKVVNSSFYGLPGQISSIDRAIVMLGLNAIKNIAVAASMGQLFRGVKLCDGFTAKDLWKHCVAVAVVSRELAKQLKLPFADEAFLAGMIHDIGMLVSLQTWPERLTQICQEARQGTRTFSEIERDVLGVDHQQLGLALAEKWQFPKACQQVAGFHHEPELLSDSARTLVILVHVADQICCEKQVGFWLTGAHSQLNESTCQSIGITPPMIEEVRNRLPDLLNDAGQFGE